jgi:predicted ATPase
VTTAATEPIGRDDDFAQLVELLTSHSLVTIVGPGAVGKTSLAFVAAGRLASSVAGLRVETCELAEVESPDAVRHAVSAALKVVEQPGTALGASIPVVDHERLLIVLDNCEHVLEAAADVAAELITTGSRVQVLATSREPLGLADERVLRLRPLPVPDAVDDPDAAESPAVLLFARRALQADPRFHLDAQTLRDVSRICRGLDGLPLALEIAAARTRVLAPGDIADRLGRRFSLLRDSARAVHRHRSLQAVVDWSYELLAPAERELLLALALHSGGADLAAVSDAAAALGIPADDMVDVLDGLVAKSLVTVSSAPYGTRYGVLETLRAYGLNQLDEAGRLSATRNRHADYYAVMRRIRAGLIAAWTYDAVPLVV